MSTSIRASKEGLEIIKTARIKKNWNKTEKKWYMDAHVEEGTLKRFLRGDRINQENFANLCKAVGINRWEDIVDWETISEKQVILIESDPEVAKNSLRFNTPYDWKQRTLYLGDGGQDWLSVSAASEYMTVDDIESVQGKIREIIPELEIQTFISMGPGDAKFDREIVDSLANDQLRYLPVDLNIDILQFAFDKIKDVAYIPVGILGDFEDGFNFIEQRLKWRVKPTTLVGLLGNTLGNLDRHEKAFLQRVINFLNPGDYILLDVTIADQNYKAKTDNQGTPSNHFSEIRRFYAGGVTRQIKSKIKISLEEILKDYEERIISIDREGNNIGDVPKTKSIDLYYEQIDEKTKVKTRVKIVSLRRYHWESFLEWLKKEFAVEIYKEESCFFKEANSDKKTDLGFGMVLLRKINL